MSSSKSPSASSPVAEWRDRHLQALCEAVPCVMADVHRITADYLVRRCVDWCTELVTIANGFPWWSLAPSLIDPNFKPPAPGPAAQDAKQIAALIAADRGVAVQAGKGENFQWMIGRQTLRESGLRRWCIWLHSIRCSK